MINNGSRRGEKVVIKKWKSRHIFNADFWDKDLECHRKAKQLVDAWNNLNLFHQTIEISMPRRRICVSGGSDEKDSVSKDEWNLVEDYIAGDFTKWNSNSGFVKNHNASIQAFCHWTYHHSGGLLVMCDAQGVKTQNRYKITDPCICSKRRLYGSTDCGVRGINSFFANHTCNIYCDKSWIRPNVIDTKKLLPKRETTTYTWERPQSAAFNSRAFNPYSTTLMSAIIE